MVRKSFLIYLGIHSDLSPELQIFSGSLRKVSDTFKKGILFKKNKIDYIISRSLRMVSIKVFPRKTVGLKWRDGHGGSWIELRCVH